MLAEPVVLYNRNRYKSFQFTLYHPIVCKEAGRCYCTTVPGMAADQRGMAFRAETSVFLPARGYSKPLPRAVLKVPQVKQALAEQPPFIQIANQLAEVQIYSPKSEAKSVTIGKRKG